MVLKYFPVAATVAAILLAAANPASAARPTAEQALRAAADQILMHDPLGNEGAPNGETPFNAGRVQLWSSTIGGINFTPEEVFGRLFGSGHTSTRATAEGWRVLWQTATGRVEIGEVTPQHNHLRLTPTTHALNWRNTRVGEEVLAHMTRLVEAGMMSAQQQEQPSHWQNPPALRYQLDAQQNNVLAQLAHDNPADPLLASLAPMPIPRFVDGEAVTRMGMDKLGQDTNAWLGAHRDPAQSHIAKVQASGELRPFEISWRKDGEQHRLGLRVQKRMGEMQRTGSYWHGVPSQPITPKPTAKIIPLARRHARVRGSH